MRHGGMLDTTRLMRATGLTRQTVLSTLRQLETVALVLPAGAGRYRSFQVNAHHPLAPPIQQLFDAEAARVERIYHAVRLAAVDAGRAVRAVWLYGSAARGDDAATSDLDLVVVVGGTDTIEPVLDKFRNAVSPMERNDGVTVATVGLSDSDVRRLSKGDPWWLTMARDSIPLVGADPVTYARGLTSKQKGVSTGRPTKPKKRTRK